MWGWGEDPSAHRQRSGVPGPAHSFQSSKKGIEIDIIHPQIGEGLKYFQITEFLSLPLFFQVSVMQLC